MSTTATDRCKCGCSDETLAEYTYFRQRQIVMAEDFTQDQSYARYKRRMHNRMLHGWGVVCGCNVHYDSAWNLTVESGYVLDPMGDDIYIPAACTFDIRRRGFDGDSVDPCPQQTDPWCSDVTVQPPANIELYLAIKYAQCKSRPVRATGCGCRGSANGHGGDVACEYSRIRDSYSLQVLRELPRSHEQLSSAPPDILSLISQSGTPECPKCPPDAWVVLATVTITDPQKGTLAVKLTNRRQVLSLAGFYYLAAT